jgi:exopolyphosphatase/pppGpp-phosphohydrolase
VRALAKLVLAKRVCETEKSIYGVSVLRRELEALAEELRTATHAERIAMPAMRAPRADLLPTGAIILTQLLESLDLPELLVSDWGLREGVLLGEPVANLTPS